ncbi:MAG: hypothetical protein DWQ07_23520 [Chloroflexi bacterium]|nr:MAG: hypothetical protein DWQ07_23520 [Chloroflexota bacterium]MBL1194120.1 hypothetical protein [Chloroflexota bacterium]NOH11413.1 hypothetical protein [Chloroflexota bacterium]
MKKIDFANIFLSLLALVLMVGCSLSAPVSNRISGVVLDGNGPIEGAIVRVQASDLSVTSDASGLFEIGDLEYDKPIVLTAWKSGYYISASEEVMPGSKDVEIHLTAHASEDDPRYEWVSAFSSAGQEGNCENCHSDESGTLPFNEWQLDAHAQSAHNVRFLSMYAGTDLEGSQSPLTRKGYSADYGGFPLRPDPDLPYYGPGYKLDFPETAGNCAACHLPAAAIDQAYSIDPRTVDGVGAEGVTCDFCHKVWDVKLNQATGLPYSNMPGVLSFEYRRPPEGHQFFAGPFDDVAPGEDTYTPIQQESEYCAPCHFGEFWDTVVYNSFGEWLDSPYSDPASGQTCQDCHMPRVGTNYFARIDQGGLVRDPQSIFSHRMPGAADIDLLRDAVTVNVIAQEVRGKVIVEVEIDNDNTGHHIPTDSPLRHLILLVSAYDAEGEALELTEGPTLPEWCGLGDAENGNYAGLPGKAYAKILQELWTEVSPTGAYWNPTRVLSDNRIPAMGTDLSTYSFADPPEGEVTIEVKLLFRRAFIELADQKGWELEDIVMARESITIFAP